MRDGKYIKDYPKQFNEFTCEPLNGYPLYRRRFANITANSSYGHYINSLSLIIIDEISMCPLQVLKIIDRLLRDLCDKNDELKTIWRKNNTSVL